MAGLKLRLYLGLDGEDEFIEKETDLELEDDVISAAAEVLGDHEKADGHLTFIDIWLAEDEGWKGEILLMCIEAFLQTLKEEMDGRRGLDEGNTGEDRGSS